MMESFGALESGESVELITLGRADGLQASILTLGGILHSLTLPTRKGRLPLTLALPTAQAYFSDPAFLGQLIGRFGNRIANASFSLDGQEHKLSVNDGANHLHGGLAGFGRRLWRVLDLQHGPDEVLRLGLSSPAGDQGFPGALEVSAEFTLLSDELQLVFRARSDSATPLNLTYHPYINLSGSPALPIDSMRLRIAAARFLPVVEGLIPTGELRPVVGTPFDYRTMRSVAEAAVASDPQLLLARGYDHCWALDAHRECDAELYSPHSRIRMRLHSDRPGLQFYAGQGLPRLYAATHGLCLEPQGFPNAVNEPAFPAAILSADVNFESRFRYVFSIDG